MPDKLNEDDVRGRLTHLDHWTVEGGKLRQEFKFGNFVEAFAFMTAAAMQAEKLDHHPEWSNVYNRVTVDLVTHSAGGITELDLALAEIMNDLAAATRR